jgi:hypothetical protein
MLTADSRLNVTEILSVICNTCLNIKILWNIPTKYICIFHVIAKYTTIIFLNGISDLQRCDTLHSCRWWTTFRSSLSSVSAWTNPSTYEVETACSSKSMYSATPAWCYKPEGEWRYEYKQSSKFKNWEFYIDCLLKWRSSVFCLTSILAYEHCIGEFEFLRFATGNVTGRH